MGFRQLAVRSKFLLAFAAVLIGALLARGTTAWARHSAGGAAIKTIEEEPGLLASLANNLVEFQRYANTEIATHRNAIERGDDLGAYVFGLKVAFL